MSGKLIAAGIAALSLGACAVTPEQRDIILQAADTAGGIISPLVPGGPIISEAISAIALLIVGKKAVGGARKWRAARKRRKTIESERDDSSAA